MLRRPVLVPLWATNPSDPSAIVEPVALTRQNGFATNDRPPAQWINWEFAQVGGCIDYLMGPTTHNWTRLDLSGEASAKCGGVAVNNDTTEAGFIRPIRRLLLVGEQSGSPVTRRIWASERGELWTEVTGSIATGISTGPSAVGWVNIPGTPGVPTADDVGCWLVGTMTGLIYTGNATTGGPIQNGGTGWASASTPSSDPIVKFACDNSGNAVAISLTRIMVGTISFGAVATFTEVTYAGSSRTGNFCDVLFDGNSWIAITTNGEIYLASTATGTWTRQSSALGTPTGSGAVWGLRCDAMPLTSVSPTGGATVVVAFARGSTQYTWYTSVDHGASWASLTQPSSVNQAFQQIYDLQWFDGAWFASGEYTPYLSTTNDITDPLQWVSIQLPFYSDSQSDGGAFGPLAYAEGRLFVFWNNSFVLASDRAVNLAPGPWQPSGTPAQLHDAAYLRGTLVSGTAPTDGEVLRYYGSTQEWTPDGRYVQTASSYVASVGDGTIGVTNTSAPRTVTLPANPPINSPCIVKDESNGAGTNPITVQGSGGAQIDGNATFLINTNRGTVLVVWNGASWIS